MKAVFIDVETTGLDFYKHVPLDVAAVVVELQNMSCIATFNELIKCQPIEWAYADKEALEINGYNFDNHDASLDYMEVGEKLFNFLIENKIFRKEAVFICQNPSFDRAFIHKLIPPHRMNDACLPYHWLDLASMYWAKKINVTKAVNGHNLCCTSSLSKDMIAYALGLPPEQKPHKAMGGVLHLIECYKHLIFP